jgi:hypothetical protein
MDGRARTWDALTERVADQAAEIHRYEKVLDELEDHARWQQAQLENYERFIGRMDTLLRAASKYIADLPLVETPEIALAIDEFLEDK